MTTAPEPIPPLRKSIIVPWTVDRAFRRFTDEIASWWPLKTHSVGGVRAVRCAVETRVGGQVYEELNDGTRHVWGTVTACEPPGRIVFTWHPGAAIETAQEVEVRFVADAGGTRLELTHTGWERLGKSGRRARRAYPLGWTYVLNLYADRRHAALNVVLNGVIFVLMGLRRLRNRGEPVSDAR